MLGYKAVPTQKTFQHCNQSEVFCKLLCYECTDRTIDMQTNFTNITYNDPNKNSDMSVSLTISTMLSPRNFALYVLSTSY